LPYLVVLKVNLLLWYDSLFASLVTMSIELICAMPCREVSSAQPAFASHPCITKAGRKDVPLLIPMPDIAQLMQHTQKTWYKTHQKNSALEGEIFGIHKTKSNFNMSTQVELVLDMNISTKVICYPQL
jgi:hypothetical protein